MSNFSIFYDIRFILSDFGKEISELVEKTINDRFDNDQDEL